MLKINLNRAAAWSISSTRGEDNPILSIGVISQQLLCILSFLGFDLTFKESILANALFLYPLKMSESQSFFDVSYKMGKLKTTGTTQLLSSDQFKQKLNAKYPLMKV